MSLASQLTVTDFSGRVDKYIAQTTGQSRVFVQEQIENGSVTLNGAVVLKPSTTIHSGNQLTVQWTEKPPSILTPIPHKLDILWEDSHLLILNKPQGTLVHPVHSHFGETLVHYILYHFQSNTFLETSNVRPGIVHRLDKGTSGVIAIAKNRVALENLAAQFKNRTVEKEYHAIVWGQRKTGGEIKAPIGRHPFHRKQMCVRTLGGRDAWTIWKVKKGFTHFTLVALFPKTGRTHQLRVHMSELGHPIVGDSVYKGGLSSKRKTTLAEPILGFLNDVQYPFLHAHKLALDHPITGQRLLFTAPLPQSFSQLLKLLEDRDS